MSLAGWERPEHEPSSWSIAWLKWVWGWMAREYRTGVLSVQVEAMLSDTDSPSRTLLCALTVAGLIPVGLGFALSLPDFIAHVLAGVSGLILGAVLAVWLIDALLSQRRLEHWHVVREQLLALICVRIVEVGADYSSALPGQQRFIDQVGPEDDPVARVDIAEGLRELTGAVRRAVPELARGEDPDRSSTRLLFEQVAPLLAPLQDAMTTRVIALGDDPGLVTHLLALERAQQSWRLWMETVERAGAPDSYAWEQATAALDTACELYEYILKIS